MLTNRGSERTHDAASTRASRQDRSPGCDLNIELPGVDAGHALRMDSRNGSLHIGVRAGNRRSDRVAADRLATFRQTIMLPDGVDDVSLRFDHHNGTLTVTAH
jgi:HSP20 family molecular chaperone IbpA